MPRHGPEDAEILVFTFKEGLLSSVAHDLKLKVTGFEISVEEDGAAVSARIDASSLRVVAARVGGEDRPQLLSPGDRQKIERNIREEVLHARQHPTISFQSTSLTGDQVTGQLALHGVTREVRARVETAPGARTAEWELDQEAFGITPFKAMLGALKVRARVKVRVCVPA